MKEENRGNIFNGSPVLFLSLSHQFPVSLTPSLSPSYSCPVVCLSHFSRLLINETAVVSAASPLFYFVSALKTCRRQINLRPTTRSTSNRWKEVFTPIEELKNTVNVEGSTLEDSICSIRNSTNHSVEQISWLMTFRFSIFHPFHSTPLNKWQDVDIGEKETASRRSFWMNETHCVGPCFYSLLIILSRVDFDTSPSCRVIIISRRKWEKRNRICHWWSRGGGCDLWENSGKTLGEKPKECDIDVDNHS